MLYHHHAVAIDLAIRADQFELLQMTVDLVSHFRGPSVLALALAALAHEMSK